MYPTLLLFYQYYLNTLRTTLWDQYCYYSYFSQKKIETLKDKGHTVGEWWIWGLKPNILILELGLLSTKGHCLPYRELSSWEEYSADVGNAGLQEAVGVWVWA